MTLAERLKSVRESTGGSQKEFATLVSASFRAWQDYEAGNSVPGGKVFESLAKLGFDTNWILTGEGPMRRGEEEGGRGEGVTAAAAGRRLDDAYVDIPLYDVKASAGAGALVEHERIVDFLAFKAEWIRVELRATPKDLYLIHVDGESMEPTLRPGDMILVDHRGAVSVPRDGIYVMRLGDTLLVKRLQRLPGNALEVTSDNPAYKPFTLKLDQMEQENMDIIGRVVWCGRRM